MSNRSKWQLIRHIGECAIRAIAKAFAWLGRIADPVAKWATTLALAIGGVWAYYQFVLGGASDWAINLSLSHEVVAYHDNLGLLVVHVRSRNPRNSEVDVERPNGAFKLIVKRVPEGLASGSVVDPDDLNGPHDLIREIDLLPKEGYVFPPQADFRDAESIVLPLGTKVWLTVRLDYGGDYVKTSRLVSVELPTASGGAMDSVSAGRATSTCQ